MSTQVQFRRGNTAQHSTFTGVIGEVTVDTEIKTLVIHDGVTAGGFPVLTGTSIPPLIGVSLTDSTLDGTTTVTGNITGNLIPSANVTYSLGSSAYRWKDLWISGSTIHIDSATITAAAGVINLPAGSTIGGSAISQATYGNTEVAAYLLTDGTITTIQANLGAYQTYANANAATQAIDLNTLFSNAATQAINIDTINANLGTATTNITTLFSNAATQATDLNTLFSNAGAQATDLNTLFTNAATQATAINTLDANVGAYETFANLRFTTLDANLGVSTIDIAGLKSNAAIQANLIDVLTGNAATQGSLLDVLVANASSQANSLITLTANAASQEASLTVLVGNAVTQATAINTFDANLGTATTNINTLFSNAATQAAGISTINSNITTLFSNAAAQATDLNTLLSNAATQAASINAINANLGTATTNINTLFSNAVTQATSINTIDANLGTATTNITTLLSNAAAQATSINTINSDITTLFSNAATQATDLNTLLSNAAAQAASINSVNANLGTATTNITTLFSNAAAQATDLNTLLSNAAAQAIDLNTLLSNAAAQATSISTINSDITTLFSNAAAQAIDLNTLFTNAATQATSINSINANLGTATTNITTLFSNAAAQATSINTIDANLGAYQIFANANVSSLQNQITGANTNIQTFNANLGTATTNITTLFSNAGAQATSINTLNTNAATQATSINTIDANLGTVTTNITTLFSNAGAQATDLNTLFSNAGAQATSITTLFSNAATQATSINTIDANIGAFGTYANTKIGTNTNSNLVVVATTTSTSTTTGALVVAGGAGIAGNLNVAGDLVATSINKLTITAPATSATLTVANGKTLTVNNTLTFTGTDASSVALGTGGTVAYTANKLSAFAATTSAELAGVISDETGSGALVFATSPTLVTPALGTPSSGVLTNCTFPTLNQNTTGSAATLTTGRTIALTGDVTYTSASFNGSANVTGTATLANVGTAGTYTKVTTDAKGRVTAGATLAATDIPDLDAGKITTGTIDSARLPSYVDDVLEFANLAAFPATGETGKLYVALDTNKVYRWSGSTYIFITSGAVDSVAGKTGVVTLAKADVGLGSVDNTADSAKSVASAAILTTARTIGGVSFDGSANINLPGVNTAGNQNTTGSAATLTTGRTIALTGDVTYTSPSFDGSANVTGTATLATVNANVGSFTNASVTVNAKGLVTAVSNGTAPVTSVTGTSPVVSSGGTTPAISLAANYGDTLNPYASKTAKFVLAAPNAADGVPTFRAIVASDIPTLNQNTTGSAATLTTARTINGVSFNGSANITVAANTTNALTIGTGLSGTSFNGSGAVTIAIDSTVATLTGTQTLTNKTLTTPRVGTGILDSNGNEVLNIVPVALAVNTLSINNAATGGPVLLSTAGTDTDINLLIQTKGTGAITLDTGTGAGQIDLKSGSSSVRVWDDDSSHYYQFVTGNRTANYNVTFPAGNVILTAGTSVVTTRSISTTAPLEGGGNLSANRTLSLAAGYGDTLNPYASKTATFVLAAPNAADGVPTFRAIVASDIPTLNQNTTGTAAGLSATLVATSGGTGQSSYAVGDLLFASTSTALSKLADVATGSALISGGVGVAPSYGKIGLTTHVSGTLPVANGGTGVTTSTGTGAVVLSTSPTLVTPALGTPSSGTLTSCTGLPIVAGTTGTLSVARGGTGVTTSTGTGDVVLGTSPTFTTQITTPSIVKSGTNAVGNIGQTDNRFNTVFATATSALYADLAENYQADAEYEPGTVVVFGGAEEITISSIGHDTSVAGVVSTNPAYLMNADSGNLPVALTGRVPCKVIGPVSKGTVLTTSHLPGIAMALDPTKFVPGCIIGKSLQVIKDDSVQTIEVAVGRF
jgi:hypothetical protein